MVFKITAHGICVKLDVMYEVIILSCCLMIIPLAFSINCVIFSTELGEQNCLWETSILIMRTFLILLENDRDKINCFIFGRALLIFIID